MAAAANEIKDWLPVLTEFEQTGRLNTGMRTARGRGASFSAESPAPPHQQLHRSSSSPRVRGPSPGPHAMPFIRRKRTAEAESTFSKVDVEHEFYVKAREVQKGDVVLKPDEIQDEILRDLAKTHPKEFAAAALERGLLDVVDDEDEDELPFSARR
jgi:hypothetical protein